MHFKIVSSFLLPYQILHSVFLLVVTCVLRFVFIWPEVLCFVPCCVFNIIIIVCLLSNLFVSMILAAVPVLFVIPCAYFFLFCRIFIAIAVQSVFYVLLQLLFVLFLHGCIICGHAQLSLLHSYMFTALLDLWGQLPASFYFVCDVDPGHSSHFHRVFLCVFFQFFPSFPGSLLVLFIAPLVVLFPPFFCSIFVFWVDCVYRV